MIYGIIASQGLGAAPPPSYTYATLDPANTHADLTLSDGNLTVTKNAGSALRSSRSTIGITGDKHYWEVVGFHILISPFVVIGICDGSLSMALSVGQDAHGWGYYEDTGQKYFNNVLSAFGSSYKSGVPVIGVAVDASNPADKKVWFSLDGVWQGSGDPATGANPAFSGITGTIYAGVSLYRGGGTDPHVLKLLFGATGLNYPTPSGFRTGLYTV